MKTLYHGTSSVNLSCIQTIGLAPGHAKGGDEFAKEHHWGVAERSAQREPSVFLADDEINAEDFARYAVEEMGGDPIIIVLRVPEPVFATFLVDELYAHDDDGRPHAWRAHSVEATYVAEVRPVAPEPPHRMLTLSELLSIS